MIDTIETIMAQQLTYKEVTIYMLKDNSKMSLRSIGTALGISYETVRSELASATEKLRAQGVVQ